jgi:hypothetical protein
MLWRRRFPGRQLGGNERDRLADFEATMNPNTDQMRMLGHYAVATRRRQRKAPLNASGFGASACGRFERITLCT